MTNPSDPVDPAPEQRPAGINVTIAGDGATLDKAQVTVNAHQGDLYQAHPWQPRWEPPFDQAQAQLDAMPRDRVPDISSLPSCSRMPFSPNPHFVGRDAALLALARALHGGARVAIGPKAAVAGIGGVGKTSVAVEFVHRYGAFFAGGVFWLSFADPATIPSEIAACGGPGLLDLHPSYGELKQDEQIALVRQAWQKPIPRLLIFDNAEDPQLVRQWAPTSGGCRVLITSRRQSWPSSLGIAALSIDVLARASSVTLLHDLAPRLTLDEADELAEELGDFPLALQLAGSYLAQYVRISVTAYLAELRSDVILAHPSLRGIHDGDVSTTAHDRHVGRTFLVSYQRLDPERDALALALLARAACLAPGSPIPVDLLLASAELGPEDATGHMALGRLADLGFVMLGDASVTLHQLVHAFAGVMVLDETALAAVEETLINQSAVHDGMKYLMTMNSLSSHIRWRIRESTARINASIARLCGNLGYYLYIMGKHEDAQQLYEYALIIREEIYDTDHPDIATTLNNLGSILKAKGMYSAAEQFYKRALGIYEKIFDEFHPLIATGLSNLAQIYHILEDDVNAKILHERALTIREQTLGATHPDTALSLNNLAGLYYATGDYAEARCLHEQALAIYEQKLGPTHPTTATCLNNLAQILHLMGDDVSARDMSERALSIREQMLGRMHPATGQSMNNLAGIYHAAGDHSAARSLYAQALAICEQGLGASHPTTQTIRDNFEALDDTKDIE